MAEEKKKKKSNNPIDEDNITDIPHLLPYAHTVGGVQIKPIDKGRVKGRAVEAMYDQTEMQLDQIRQQIELLAQQAKNIHDRVNISEDIYLAEMNFEPLIGFTYHLYEKKDGKKVLSMVGPE
jgi:ABC-type phosphate/phosphonate transport system ATPase subunit